jgi:tetratricopeptide (TPR) repeat protein
MAEETKSQEKKGVLRKRWGLKLILFLLTTVIVLSVFLYSLAPTASFWDCGELIACSYILGIPHPPGAPLYINLGRLFSLIPISREVAYRLNFFTALMGAISCGFVYLLVVKLLEIEKRPLSQPILHLSGILAGLLLGFAYSFWDNSVETEVYTPCVIIALVVLYFAIIWREKRERGETDNRLVLFAIFLLFLSAGIHFTPMMIFLPLLIYGLAVDRKAILELRVIELLILYLAFVLISGLELVDYFVLFLASPTVAMIDLLKNKGGFFFLLWLIYFLYLFYLSSKKRLDGRYVFFGLFLIFLASTVQFYLMVRSAREPAINEVAPTRWRQFVGVLKREQYDPMKLYPRKTQFLTEEDYRNYPNSTPYLGLIPAYWEQIKFYLRYLFWQWAGEQNFDIFYHITPFALASLIPILLGILGMVNHYKREKKSFLLIFLCFLVASLGLLTYLNLKYSPSDPREHLKFREVRERDYFYAFSYVFFTIFIGLGIYYLLAEVFPTYLKKVKPILKITLYYLAFGIIIILPIASVLFNYPNVTRRYNFIPAEYGYNMLISCEGEKAVIFTNGDNDTFPLWFVQETPSFVNNYQAPFKRNVAVANLSLLNTTWYCKQLKKWGAPISFSEKKIEELPQGIYGKDGRVYLLKDIIIRDLLATNAGIKLVWPDDYLLTPHEFRQKVLKNYREEKGTKIYFASTVSRDNLYDVEPWLKTCGLVQLVVPDSGENQIDVAKTESLLYSVYKMKSMLDKRVMKDENTRGLLINYAANYLALAQEYQKRGNLDEAMRIMEKALAFDLDKQRKSLLYYNLSYFALMAQKPNLAIAYLDSIEKLGVKDFEILLRKGIALQSLGEIEKAEKSFQEALQLAPNRPEAVQALYTLYLTALADTPKAKEVLVNWLKRNPHDTVARGMLKRLGG